MNSVYFVAEIGQNHNGDYRMAEHLIDVAAMPIYDKAFDRQLQGVDAVKFVRRDLSAEVSNEVAKQTYNSPHSFGKTYLEHRKSLELSEKELVKAYMHTKAKGLDFVLTICNPGALDILDNIKPDYIKVASRDLNNVPLLEALGELDIPKIISTGMGNRNEIRWAVKIVKPEVILHCVSKYPLDYIDAHLKRIQALKREYPKLRIGWSDHTIGIATPLAAVALGAEVIEKHITLDRGLKGSDQSGSLAPEGLWRCVRDVRNIEAAMSGGEELNLDALKLTKEKLGRSLAFSKDLRPNHIILKSDLHMISPGVGLPYTKIVDVLGRKTKYYVKRNDLVNPEELY